MSSILEVCSFMVYCYPLSHKRRELSKSAIFCYIFLEGAKTTTTSVPKPAVFHPCLASPTVRSRKSGVKAPKYAIKPLQTITSPEHRTARLGGVGTRQAYARLKSCRIIIGHVISERGTQCMFSAILSIRNNGTPVPHFGICICLRSVWQIVANHNFRGEVR